MSRLSKTFHGAISGSRFPLRSLLLLIVILLFTFVATALAQDDTPLPDAPEMEIISETELPYGIQTVARVYVVQDAFIASGQPNTNYGSWSTMRIGYEAPSLQAVRSLMQFDLSPIPSTAQVNNAVLNIYQSNSNPLNDAPMGFKAQYMVAPWNESSVTWHNANYLGGATIGIGNNTSALGWKQSNVTSMVLSWISGAEPNYGLIVTGDESPSNNRSRWFNTANAGSSFRPFIDVDYTSCTDTTKPFASINPLSAWSKGSFTVSWSGSDSGGSGIAYYNIQYSQNGGSWTSWLSHTTSTSATFNGANNQTYSFRAQAVDKCGNVQDWTSAQATTTVDSVAPQASVNALPQYTLSPSFPVNWSGTDNPGGSGIKNYDIQVRVDNGAWTDWLTGVNYTSAVFGGATNLSTYEFRARATDVVGNVQPYSNDAQAVTLVVLEPLSVMLPISPPITGADNVTLEWIGVTVPGTSITEFDIRYRFNYGNWIDWNSFPGNQTSALFTFPNPDGGKYEFEVRVTNSIGQTEPWTGVPEAFVIYDKDGEFSISAYMPLVILGLPTE